MAYGALTREELIARLESAERSTEQLESVGADRLRLVHELQVHQLELETQNQALRDAHQELEVSRERYAALYDFAPIAYCTLDNAGKIIDINLTGAAFLGRERAELIGLPFSALVHPADLPPLFAHLLHCRESGGSVVGELTITTPKGRFEVEANSRPVFDAEGQSIGSRTAFVDITDRKRAERARAVAHANEQHLRRRLEVLHRAMTVMTGALLEAPAGGLTRMLQIIADQSWVVAESECVAIGLSQAEMPFEASVFSGEVPAAFQALCHAPEAVDLFRLVAFGEKNVRLRDLREHPAGAALRGDRVSFLGIPVRWDGRVVAALYLVGKRGAEEFDSDDERIAGLLAQRIAAMVELVRLSEIEARERARLAFVVQIGPALAETIEYRSAIRKIVEVAVPTLGDLCAVYLREREALVMAASWHTRPSTRRLLHELEGTPAPISAAAYDDAYRRQQPLLEGPVDEPFLTRMDGEPKRLNILRQLSIRSSLIVPLVARGQTLGLLHFARTEHDARYTQDDVPLAIEIAALAAAAIERGRLYEQAQQATRARDELLAIVSHDLRSPLGTILLAVRTLASSLEGVSGKVARQIDLVGRAARRMGQLIESLRDVGMIESGQLAVKPARHPVDELVREALQLLEPQAVSKGIQLEWEGPTDLPDLWCDQERFFQIVANLVGNAIKFSDQDTRVVVEAAAGDGVLRFSVTDQGAGIPADHLSRLFNRYWRGVRAERSSTGLGLYITKGIVEAHGGRIWVESDEGKGTAVYFTLLVARNAADEAQRHHEPAPALH